MERCRRRAPYFLCVMQWYSYGFPQFHNNNLPNTELGRYFNRNSDSEELSYDLFHCCSGKYFKRKKKIITIFNYRIKTSASCFSDKAFDPVLVQVKGVWQGPLFYLSRFSGSQCSAASLSLPLDTADGRHRALQAVRNKHQLTLSFAKLNMNNKRTELSKWLKKNKWA